MPEKILARIGHTLSGIYNLRGSVGGPQELESENVLVTHEMGALGFAERLSTAVRASETGDLLQSVEDVTVLTDFPGVPFMLHGVTVLADTAARIDRASVCFNDGSGREMPVFWWNSAAGVEATIRIDPLDAGVATFSVLARTSGVDALTPRLMVSGPAQLNQQIAGFTIRVTTAGFGAGTVEMTTLFHISFAEIGGLQSYGLPTPSW